MYLAQWRKNGKRHYTIRQSYTCDGGFKSRDLFELGPNPADYIVYVGGNGYYYRSDIIDGLAASHTPVSQDELDDLMFPFLTPEIQRTIHGFDRGRRRSKPKAIDDGPSAAAEAHLFDKRRLHYLRFGHSDQRHITKVRDRLFWPLYSKSRDELEQYFMVEERRLRTHERPFYISVIFELNRFVPNQDSSDLHSSDQASTDSPMAQMDAFFLSKLCRLNKDRAFWADLPTGHCLHDYLVRYAVMYFDYAPPQPSPWQAYVEDFIRRHRVYHPPQSVQIKLEEAGRLFGMPWKELKKLDKASLTRLYRRLAMKFHPDQGGDPELFRRLTSYYKVLSDRHRR